MLFTGGVTSSAFADEDDEEGEDDGDDKGKKEKTLESECAKKKPRSFDGLFCQTIFDIQSQIDSLVVNITVNWNDIVGIPADIADGDDDTQLTEEQVDTFVSNNGFSTGPHTVDTDTTYSGADFALSDQSCPSNQYVSGIDSNGNLICDSFPSSTPDCSALNHCSANGQCIADNVCQCDTGFSGTDCSIPDTAGIGIFAGFVSNSGDPTIPGNGISTAWAYTGTLGIEGGNQMCQAIGADHVCSYQELVDADAAGEFSGLPNMISTSPEEEYGPGFISELILGGMYVNRLTEVTFTDLNDPNQLITSSPGTGGRCSDWTLPSPHIGDGEFAELIDGSLKFYFDEHTAYTGNSETSLTNPNTGYFIPYDPNFAPACFGATERSIPCCNMP